MADLESIGGKLYSNGEEVTTPSYLTAEPGDWVSYPSRVPDTVYTNDTEHILDVRVTMKSQDTASSSFHYFFMGGQKAPGSRFIDNVSSVVHTIAGGLVKPGEEMYVEYNDAWGTDNPEISDWYERVWL